MTKKINKIQTLKRLFKGISRTAIVAVVAANLFPIIGIVFLHWEISELITLYWYECGVIGVYLSMVIIRAGYPGIILLPAVFFYMYTWMMQKMLIADFFDELFFERIRLVFLSAYRDPDLNRDLWIGLFVLLISYGTLNYKYLRIKNVKLNINGLSHFWVFSMLQLVMFTVALMF